MLDKFIWNIRMRAWQKGYEDGRRWNRDRRFKGVPSLEFPKYFKPTIFFTEYYTAGFDKAAELETDG